MQSRELGSIFPSLLLFTPLESLGMRLTTPTKLPKIFVVANKLYKLWFSERKITQQIWSLTRGKKLFKLFIQLL